MHRLAGLFRKGNDFAEKNFFVTGKKVVSADLFIRVYFTFNLKRKQLRLWDTTGLQPVVLEH